MQTQLKTVILAVTTLYASILGPLVASAEEAKILETPAGIRFSWLGEKSRRPAPTLFVFAKDKESSLEREAFAKMAWLLVERGFIAVALDLPSHGEDQKADEPERLAGWAARVEKGDTLVPAFMDRTSQVLDFLVKSGYTNVKQVAACGISRGGFMALHFAAADPRVRWVVALAPVTDLGILTEFSKIKDETAVRALSVMNIADKLTGRGVWIYIGNDDARVGTEAAIAFARLVTRKAVATKQRANVKLTVDASEGHGVGLSPHFEGADWIESQLRENP